MSERLLLNAVKNKKQINKQKEIELLDNLGILEQKQILTKEDEVELAKIQSQLDLIYLHLIYLHLAKGVFIHSRAK